MMLLADSVSGLLATLPNLGVLAQIGAQPENFSQVDQSLGRGFTIALVGLFIVFAVLILLSLFIAALPKIVSAIEEVLPAPDHSHADHALAGGHPESQLPDDVVIAAIGYVLHTELQNQSVKK